MFSLSVCNVFSEVIVSQKTLKCPIKKSPQDVCLVVLYPNMRLFFGILERFYGMLEHFFETPDTKFDCFYFILELIYLLTTNKHE